MIGRYRWLTRSPLEESGWLFDSLMLAIEAQRVISLRLAAMAHLSACLVTLLMTYHGNFLSKEKGLPIAARVNHLPEFTFVRGASLSESQVIC